MKIHYLLPGGYDGYPMCFQTGIYDGSYRWKTVTCKKCLRWKPKKKAKATT